MSKKELQPKCSNDEWLFGSCRNIDDLAQCPECHLWFCKLHDWHDCISQPQTSDLQERIASAKMRRDLGVTIWVFDILAFVAFLFILDRFVEYLLSRSIAGFLILYSLIPSVALLVLGAVIHHHYQVQLRKLGVHRRSIRPQTTKKDR